VWDALTCECIRTLVGHTWAVFSLALWEERTDEGGCRMRLFSGSGDHNIRVRAGRRLLIVLLRDRTI
jgi:hypothetical protein